MRAILSFVSLAWCLVAASAADAASATAEDPIREAVFRYQFSHLTPEQQQVRAKFYSLGYGPKTTGPSKAFLERFKDNEPAVKEGALVIGDRNGWFLKGSTDRGLVFSVTKIKWLSDTEVTVYAGCEETALRGAWHTYRLKAEKDQWSVVNVE